MTQLKENIPILKDTADLIGTCARWGTILVGGFCLLLYSNEIGHFPEGLDLGEGLAFYLVCAGFWLAYSVYVLIATAIGSLLWGRPAGILEKLGSKRNVKKHPDRVNLETDFSPMWEFPVWVLAVFGFLILVLLYRDISSVAIFLGVSLLQGMLVVLLLVVRRRGEYLRAGFMLKNESAEVIEKSRLITLTTHRILLALIVIFPLALGPDKTALVSTAFRVAQLRKENATVHVKKPWAARVSISTLKGGTSFLGDDHVEFKGVKVLLRSVGEKVIIELPQSSGKAIKLPIPSESIYVE
ncbi:hypothetical protein [Polaromonas sp. AER18D-145]|uniref:hypothetical protein n=1 Tax=Polaromonas sp. AER18D-145 TaxID=1977060 RepID=UPI000BBC4F1E|nr:hypothetical protein [Polaromonas sp. AER18D-145]